MKYSVISVIVMIFFASCEEEPFEMSQNLSDHQAYFYNEVGTEKIYKVDSIQFDYNTEIQKAVSDTGSYYIREFSNRIFTTQDGLEWIEIRIDRRENPGDAWRTINYVRERIESNRALRYEDGLVFIKMEFPISNFGSWDGNALFHTPHILFIKGETIEEYEDWNYEYLETDETMIIDNEQIGDLVRVQHRVDDEGNLFRDESYELYAKDFGLVKKVREYLKSECQRLGDPTEFCINNPTELHADRGYIYRQELIELNRP